MASGSDNAGVRTATIFSEPPNSATSGNKGLVRPINGRYKLLEHLGSGGMATVHRARDLQRDCDVAIKFMKSDLGGTARRRFFREFNTIAGIDHPCCLRVYEIGETAEAPYFTMELHPGQAVTSIFGESPQNVAAMLVDITLAVDYIHSQGIVHRDIKPSNVLVERTGGKSDSRITAKLADFGLAKFYQLDSSLTAERGLVGTPAYCAPEQVDGSEIDHRVDLYAIGVLAYELLSGGVHPFAKQRERGVSALLQAQLSVVPDLLTNDRYSIPDTVAKVVASYLAKDAEHRPESAALLRQSLVEAYDIEVESRLEQMSTPSAVRLNALGFVCRDAELEEARHFLQSNLRFNGDDAGPTALEQATLLVISGEPGAGKSSVMQEIARRAIGSGCRVYEGRCFDGSAAPFQPFIEIIRHIFVGLRRKANSGDESTLLAEGLNRHIYENNQLEKILTDYRQELLRVAPELRRWLQGEAQEPAFRNDADYIVRALATMLIEISQVRPLCLCFDDIQWADQSSLALLQHLAVALRRQSAHTEPARSKQPNNIKPPGLVLICTGRSGYEQLSGFLAKAESRSQVHVIDIAVFGPEETRQMLALRLGCLPGQIDSDLVETIENLCHGNPFFISETVREWYSRGIITRTTNGWQLLKQSHDDSSLPTSVRSALRGRVAELAETTQAMLPVAAAIGRVVDLDLLGAVLSDTTEVDLLDGIDELLSKRILVETNAASRLEFSHDLMRELVLAELTSTRRRSIHRRIGEAMENKLASGSKAASNALLAMHFHAGEMSEKAFEYLVKAGQDALLAYAFGDALQPLQQAEELQTAELNREAKYEMYSLLAEAYSGNEKMEQAISAAHSALSCAGSRMEKGKIIAKIAWYEQKRGELREAWKRYDEALSVLGVNRPKSLPFVLLSTQLNLFYFHFVPKPLLKLCLRKRMVDAELPELLCQISYDLAWIVAPRDLFCYIQICSMNAASSRLTQSGNSSAIAKYGMNLGVCGINFLALRYANKAIKSANNDSRPEIVAMARSNISAILLFAGRLNDAEKAAMDSISILERCGDHHASLAYHWLRHIKSVRGQSSKIIAAAEKEIAIAAKTRDNELIGYGYYGLTHGLALCGKIDQAISAGSKSLHLLTQIDSGFRAIAHIEQGFAMMQASRYPEAVESLTTAISIMNKYLHYYEIHMAVFPRLAEALLGPTWNVTTSNTKIVRQARRYARRAKLFSTLFPNIRPHAWRIWGRVHFAGGKPQKARKCFERAIIEAEKLGARYELARSHDDLGRAFPEFAHHRQQANAILHELEAVIPEAERGE